MPSFPSESDHSPDVLPESERLTRTALSPFVLTETRRPMSAVGFSSLSMSIFRSVTPFVSVTVALLSSIAVTIPCISAETVLRGYAAATFPSASNRSVM